MTDNLDRACEAAWEAVQRRRSASDLEQFGAYPWWSVKDSPTGDTVRDSIAAALRVMADDLRALHVYHEPPLPHLSGYCERCSTGGEYEYDWPCEHRHILDSYVGGES